MDKQKDKKNKAKTSLPDDIGELSEIEIEDDGVRIRSLDNDEILQARLEGIPNTGELTGGDIYADQYQAEVVGEEAVGGMTPTPDQNVTEYLERSVGLEMDDRSFLRTNDILEQRDDQRWELDPMSSEDYQERRE
jgi:hypothetical protein